MKKSFLKISVIIFTIMFVLINMTNVSYGGNNSIQNNNQAQQSDEPKLTGIKQDLYGSSNTTLTTAASKIAGVIEYMALAFAVGMLIIKWAGAAIAVGMLMFIGIKYVTASPDGKADVKKELIPWSIGVVLLFTLIMFINQVVIPLALKFNG